MDVSCLQNDKILDWTKLRAFADKKVKVYPMFCLWKGRKHSGKRRKCWLQPFSPFLLQGCKKQGLFGIRLKVALQILGRKFYKKKKKSSFYSQSLLILIHRTPVVERHPITRQIGDLLWPRSTPMGNTVYITWAACSFTHWKYTDEASNIAFDEDIMENNYMFVMLWNLNVISLWIFFLLFLAPNLKIT